MIIDSKPWQVGSLLEGKYFHIPRYQRPYSWERSHLEDFWQDAIQDRGDEEYFIGSIVTAKPRNELVYAVVDGQQRLTTITILLCVLRDAFQAAGDSDLAEGTQTFIERRNRENKLQFVLTTESSYPYFQEHIQKRGKPELQGNASPEEMALKTAKEYFAERVAETIGSIRANVSLTPANREKEVLKQLRALRERLLSLQVIFVELENEDDAYLVFETLNTRGKDLRAADLVKNLILRLKKPTTKGVDVAKEKWNEILETLEESESSIRVDAYLHHSWLSRHEFVAQKKLFLAVKNAVNKTTVNGFLDELVSDATLYRVLYEPEFRESKWIQQEFPIRNSLRAIDQFGVRLSVPLLLSLLRDWEEGSLKLSPVRDTITAIETFHFLFNAVAEQRATGGLSRMFASMAGELCHCKPKDKVEKCAEIRKKLKARIPDYDTFRVNFGKIVFTKTQTKQKNLVKYILAKVAEHRSWQIDISETSIEHFAPQSGSLSETVVGQLGNLLLVPPKLNNEKLGDKDAVAKRAVLKKAKYPIPDAMEKGGTWGKTEIEKHTMELAEISYKKIWKIQ